ncbi:hypothetical protein E2C01_027804 [Portunus trituberculatus]|uniref:Uncharacterized protein n=1 Tax=Portunus trituberculatus TaxID=210409 RepID=A0A5B7EMB2_PORTR|nr:hypothetical protein [Portunus trituberculatus]
MLPFAQSFTSFPVEVIDWSSGILKEADFRWLRTDWWRAAYNHQHLEDLAWWVAPEDLLTGAPFMEQSVCRFIPAWVGAHLGTSLASRVWSLEGKGFHINQLWLLAAFLSLQMFCQYLPGSVVSVMSDSMESSQPRSACRRLLLQPRTSITTRNSKTDNKDSAGCEEDATGDTASDRYATPLLAVCLNTCSKKSLNEPVESKQSRSRVGHGKRSHVKDCKKYTQKSISPFFLRQTK